MRHYRGRFGLGEWNCQRYGVSAWKVPTLIPELSMIQAQSVEGSVLRYGPSMIQAQSVEGPRLDTEPSTIWSINVEGSRLDAEPSMIWGIIVEGSRLRYGPSVISSLSVEGSTLGSRTIRDMCLYRGWLLCLHRTVHEIGPKRRWFAPGY